MFKTKANLFTDKVKVELLRSIDVRDIDWCSEAVLFRVKDGKGTLTHQISEEDADFDYFSQLHLTNLPIIQAKYPSCPTCAGMLATGYGIENIDSPELKRVREGMNSEYVGIVEALESMKPLLGLLDSGYYVLADTLLYPTDGQGNFFYSVPNEPVYNDAAGEWYYNFDFCSVMEGFPAYIYPTQSAELIQEQRVDTYVELFRNSTNPPRALAYHEKGFVCALLDGHHKACAAAVLGEKLHCLTIIRPTTIHFKDAERYHGGDTLLKSVDFAGISVPANEGETEKDYRQISGRMKGMTSLPVYHVTGRSFSKRYSDCYPTINCLTGIMLSEVNTQCDMMEYTKQLLAVADQEAITKLKYFMDYLYCIRSDTSFQIAQLILDRENDFFPRLPLEGAIKILLYFKNEISEQYLIDYLANHSSDDQYWDLVSSYWE